MEYSTSEGTRIVGITKSQAREWYCKYMPLEYPCGYGGIQKLTETDILRLAVMKHLLKLNLPRRVAGEIAQKVNLETTYYETPNNGPFAFIGIKIYNIIEDLKIKGLRK